MSTAVLTNSLNCSLDFHFNELHSKLLPAVGDYIMYQGELSEVVQIKYFKRMMVVKHLQTKVSLELKVGYRIFQKISA